MGVFRHAPGCGCCSGRCELLLGPFCDCCGLLAAGSLRLTSAAGFDALFPIENGMAPVWVPASGVYTPWLVGPYPARRLPDITVSDTTPCTFTPAVTAYAPPDRPSALTATLPSGQTVALAPCATSVSGCTSGQPTVYQGQTTVTLTHGCWCGTATSITLPIVVQWRFGPPCQMHVWVPVCSISRTSTTPSQVMLSLCGSTVPVPGPCEDPTSLVIPIVPHSGSTVPCQWLDLALWDVDIYNQPLHCDPLYWVSAAVPALAAGGPACTASAASSFVWPMGGSLTLTP